MTTTSRLFAAIASTATTLVLFHAVVTLSDPAQAPIQLAAATAAALH